VLSAGLAIEAALAYQGPVLVQLKSYPNGGIGIMRNKDTQHPDHRIGAALIAVAPATAQQKVKDRVSSRTLSGPQGVVSAST